MIAAYRRTVPFSCFSGGGLRPGTEYSYSLSAISLGQSARSANSKHGRCPTRSNLDLSLSATHAAQHEYLASGGLHGGASAPCLAFTQAIWSLRSG